MGFSAFAAVDSGGRGDGFSDETEARMMRRWVGWRDGKFGDLCEGNWRWREGKAREVEAIFFFQRTLQ